MYNISGSFSRDPPAIQIITKKRLHGYIKLIEANLDFYSFYAYCLNDIFPSIIFKRLEYRITSWRLMGHKKLSQKSDKYELR